MSAAQEHIATATFGCGVIPLLLRRGDYDSALFYAEEIRKELAAVVRLNRPAGADRCTVCGDNPPVAVLRPLVKRRVQRVAKPAAGR